MQDEVTVKLSADAILAEEKFRQYLLKKLPDSDKSGFLASAGYNLESWSVLRDDIRTQLLPLEATLSRQTPFGELYEIRGTLTGPNGRRLKVISVWMIEAQSDNTKFITLYPLREQ